MALYSTFVSAIDSYLGLTPSAFFTILALMVGAYLLVSSFFVSPDQHPVSQTIAPASLPTDPIAPPEPVQLGDAVTLEELRAFDGSDPKKPLLMAIKGNIYDVSRGRMFYGPGGPYALFAGRDASRALALMSFDSKDLTGNLEGLGSDELEVLQDWEYKFMEKYVKVGQLVSGKTTSKEDNQNNEKSERAQNSPRDADDASEDMKIKERGLDAESKEIGLNGEGS